MDDNPDVRMIFSTILESDGYRVVQAANGVDGLTAAENEKPDLVILDLMMPHMDGWEVMATWAADPADFPVMAVTASQQTDRPIREEGFCALLRKPVPPDQIVKAAAHCLEAHDRGDRWTPQLASVLSR